MRENFRFLFGIDDEEPLDSDESLFTIIEGIGVLVLLIDEIGSMVVEVS